MSSTVWVSVWVFLGLPECSVFVAPTVPGLRPSQSDYQPLSGLQGCAPAPSLSPLKLLLLSTVGSNSLFNPLKLVSSSLLTAIKLEAGWTCPSNAPVPSHSPLISVSSTIVGDLFWSRLTVEKLKPMAALSTLAGPKGSLATDKDLAGALQDMASLELSYQKVISREPSGSSKEDGEEDEDGDGGEDHQEDKDVHGTPCCGQQQHGTKISVLKMYKGALHAGVVLDAIVNTNHKIHYLKTNLRPIPTAKTTSNLSWLRHIACESILPNSSLSQLHTLEVPIFDVTMGMILEYELCPKQFMEVTVAQPLSPKPLIFVT
ncbi:hypothetical protein EDB86DRAFT_2833427 [Lactarius hatsudake]|nr:hypothetical protein EDB86DRAFT_2833427 [Lactarius hatsudake]